MAEKEGKRFPEQGGRQDWTVCGLRTGREGKSSLYFRGTSSGKDGIHSSRRGGMEGVGRGKGGFSFLTGIVGVGEEEVESVSLCAKEEEYPTVEGAGEGH